ncbi:helix-turn-helix domain-containing protein [Yunchengibacter salinarum]|uniref:helix-turn-helix domain-containing protein n=1 Tax=Yunchengibacter salinarum TaxID=3133399 RepID=UPI0035B582DC
MRVDGQKLYAARLRRSWTQAQLAEASCLSLRTVQRVERHGAAAAETIQALVATLEVDVQDLAPPLPEPGGAVLPVRWIPPVLFVAGLAVGFIAGVAFG